MRFKRCAFLIISDNWERKIHPISVRTIDEFPEDWSVIREFYWMQFAVIRTAGACESGSPTAVEILTSLTSGWHFVVIAYHMRNKCILCLLYASLLCLFHSAFKIGWIGDNIQETREMYIPLGLRTYIGPCIMYSRNSETEPAVKGEISATSMTLWYYKTCALLPESGFINLL